MSEREPFSKPNLLAFNCLLEQYDDSDEASRKQIVPKVETMLSGVPEGLRKDFLWESLRMRISKYCQAILEILEEEPIRRLYEIAPGEQIPPEEAYYVLHHRVARLEEHVDGLNFSRADGDERLERYPYNKFDFDDPEMEMITQLASHDLMSVPALNQGFARLLNYFRKKEKNGNERTRQLLSSFAFSVYEDMVLNFQAFKAVAERDYPQAEFNLARILAIAQAEAVARLADLGVNQVTYGGVNLVLREEKARKVEIDVKSEPNLPIVGNQAACRLVFYQLLINSSRFLINKQEKGEVKVDAGNCIIGKEGKGISVVCVRFVDNGPGVDFAEVLRRAQREAGKEETGESVLAEDVIKDRWLCLDLRLIEVMEMIFQARIGYNRWPGYESGMGLTLAKRIVDVHGGAIWVTNRLGKEGTEFLLLFDPSSDGRLRKEVPELFQNQKIPAEILNSLDKQLDSLQ